MTDSEIIKALECCMDCDCKNCPCQTEDGHCLDLDEGLILDLINRQKAEIERLKEPLQKLSEIGYCHNFQLERSDLVSWIYDVCSVIKAVKEMTEVSDERN